MRRQPGEARMGAFRYQVRARANLRHYLPGADEATTIETVRPLTARSLLEKLNIPECEVVLVTVGGEAVDLDQVIEESSSIEIFPILSGG